MDCLPLLPGKGRNGECGDVRPLLRRVFCSLRAPLAPAAPLPPAPPPSSALPPLAPDAPKGNDAAVRSHWSARYAPDALRRCESELRRRQASRTARTATVAATWRRRADAEPISVVGPASADDCCDFELLGREDLEPAIVQGACQEQSKWVKEVLVDPVEPVLDTHPSRPVEDVSCPQASLDFASDCSLSIGSLTKRTPPPAPLPPPAVPLPEVIVCIPPFINFVNCVVGQDYSVEVRLVNVSDAEAKVSLRPPARRELDVQLCGRLTVTAGASVALLVLFKPRDVRSLSDEMLVRVSRGRSLRLPIACYMQPPIMDVFVLNASSKGTEASSDARRPTTEEAANEAAAATTEADVVDLGARLLGDTHHVTLLLRSPDADHATFFALPEDTWLSHAPAELTTDSTLVWGEWALWPATWRGGRGAVRGQAWCRARAPGLQSAPLRLLASTAVARPLTLIADAVLFHPSHVVLQAQEKTYDILSPADPDCEHYVNLGVAFPGRSLSASVLLLNNSPVSYSYYWSVRTWGECTCWQEEMATYGYDDEIDEEERREWRCPTARRVAAEAKDPQAPSPPPLLDDDALKLLVSPSQSSIAPRASCAQRVFVPDVGAKLGVHRAVLILVLERVPRASFPADYIPSIINEETVEKKRVPGMEISQHVVCDIAVCQLEVWWEVMPLRFVVAPAVLELRHSWRVTSATAAAHAVQLWGSGPACQAKADWACPQTGNLLLAKPPRLALKTGQPVMADLCFQLLPDSEFSRREDVLELVAPNNEWRSSITIVRSGDARHPALTPAHTWLGLVMPGAPLHATLHLTNDTYQNICWWGSVWRWWSGYPLSDACRLISCGVCHERRCSCEMVRPTRGALQHGAQQTLVFDVNAPDNDGCVIALVSVRRSPCDLGGLAPAPGVEGRAALLAYRLLAPSVSMRVLPCSTNMEISECFPHCKSTCALDSPGEHPACVLRPRQALRVGLRSCYRLEIRNHTPQPTLLSWDPPVDGEEYCLKVTFLPNSFEIFGYASVEVRVVVEARVVTSRRVYVRRATLRGSSQPLFLLIDAEVAGLEVELEVPIGGEQKTDAFLVMNIKQREESLCEKDAKSPSKPEAIFALEDYKRLLLAENRCHCHRQLRWIPPPPKPPKPPAGPEDPPSIEILTVRPLLTPVCACDECGQAPVMPDDVHRYCIQFWHMPLRTEWCRRVRLRNVCPLTAHWSAVVRRTRLGTKHPLDKNPWSGVVQSPGLGLLVAPAKGVLAGHSAATLQVLAYADSCGIYYDQILIRVEHLPPIVLDVWVEALGAPLHLLMTSAKPEPPADPVPPGPCPPPLPPPVLWLSTSDPQRLVRARNVSRDPLLVHAFVSQAYESYESALPLRLYLRLFDVPARDCACVHAFDSSASSESVAGESPGESSRGRSDAADSAVPDEMDVGVELFLAEDFGPQRVDCFEVEPQELEVLPGKECEWRVTMLEGDRMLRPPTHTVFMRMRATPNKGPWWMRVEQPPMVVSLRPCVRRSALHVPQSAGVSVSALRLPAHDMLRMRKKFRIQNFGDVFLDVVACIEPREAVGRASAGTVASDGQGGDGDGAAMAAGVTEHDAPFAAWALLDVEPRAGCGTGCGGACGPGARGAPTFGRGAVRQQAMLVRVDARSSRQMCAEAALRTCAAWPQPAGAAAPCFQPFAAGDDGDDREPPLSHLAPLTPYDPQRQQVDYLCFYERDHLLASMELTVDLELPLLRAHPRLLDLGFAGDGNVRKDYFELRHTSRTDTLHVSVEWKGAAEFSLAPLHLALGPREAGRVYVRYVARWRGGAGAFGVAEARAQGPAGAWCRADVLVRAQPCRDRKCSRPPHDHTDDSTLPQQPLMQ